jgi:hypothetical protein
MSGSSVGSTYISNPPLRKESVAPIRLTTSEKSLLFFSSVSFFDKTLSLDFFGTRRLRGDVRGMRGDGTDGPVDHESLAEVLAKEVDGVADMRRMVGIGFEGGCAGDSVGTGDADRLIDRDRNGKEPGIVSRENLS